MSNSAFIRLAINWSVAAVIIGGSAGLVCAQRASATPEPPGSRIKRDDDDPLSSMEEEMRAKRELRYAEKEYRDNIERAHELAELGTALGQAFKKSPQLGREEWKKLDRLEKLAKAIRNAAGGSEDDEKEKEAPSGLAKTVAKMLEVIESLAKRVEKTPRHVISAGVIDEANVLLELIRTLRQLTVKA